MTSGKPIAALPFVLLSGIADACDSFTISGSVADHWSGADTWVGVFRDPPRNGAEAVASTWVSEGEFELEVSCAESVTLIAARKGEVPVAMRMSRSASPPVKLRFAQGLSLTGSVHSDENLPVEGARVSVTRTDEAVRLPESLTTWQSAKEGAFVAGGLAPATYRVSASAEGHIPAELPEVVVVKDAANRVDMQLPKAFYIAGRVIDTTGLAVAAAEIQAADATATSDSEGAFRIGPFRKAQRVYVSARTHLSRSDTAYFLAPMNDVVLTLHDAVELRGSVSNAFTGDLLDDFALAAYAGETRLLTFQDAAGELSAVVSAHTVRS